MAEYEEDMKDLRDEFKNLATVAAGDKGKTEVQASINFIVGKLEQIAVDKNDEHMVRIFEGKMSDSYQGGSLRNFKLPNESTGVIGTVLGDADSLILHNRQGKPYQLTVIVGDDGLYQFSFPADSSDWITMLNRDGYESGRQRWEIWLLKERYAGHFRAVSIRPHSSRDTRIPQAGVAGEDRPAAADKEEDEEEENEEENPPAEDADGEDDEEDEE